MNSINWIDGKFGRFSFVGNQIIDDQTDMDGVLEFARKHGVDDAEAWGKFWKIEKSKHDKALEKSMREHWDIQTG